MSLNKSELYTIRDVKAEDKNFILATWLRGLRYGNNWFEAIDKDAYFSVYQKAVEIVLALPATKVKVACLIDDPDIILGYSVYSGSRLDWLFVKKAWRGIGIAKALTPKDFNTVSHLTIVGMSIVKKYPTVKFNPFSFGK